MSKSYCMNCKKEVSEAIGKCECGGRFFAYGDKFHLGENGIVCDCGNDKFRGNMHMDFTHKAVNNYVCTECGNPIGTESYRSGEDLMYWCDDEAGYDFDLTSPRYKKRVRNRQKLFNKRKALGRV